MKKLLFVLTALTVLVGCGNSKEVVCVQDNQKVRLIKGEKGKIAQRITTQKESGVSAEEFEELEVKLSGLLESLGLVNQSTYEMLHKGNTYTLTETQDYTTADLSKLGPNVDNLDKIVSGLKTSGYKCK